MAMLREDHLFDADRAINELRQIGRSERAAAAAARGAEDVTSVSPGSAGAAAQNIFPVAESAGLALVEIYRDVKTGHPAEAVAIFEDRLSALRDQLGHRVADAYALAARAYDLLGREAEAADAYRRATLLCPPVELHRRYPEVAKLQGRYEPAAAPPEMA
jgi:tetratricopeptide (TPR) repeat protein